MQNEPVREMRKRNSFCFCFYIHLWPLFDLHSARMLGGWPLVGSSKARTPRATESSTLEGQAQHMYNTKCTKSYKDIQSMTCPNCPHCVLFVTHLLHTCETTKGTDCPRQTISSKSRQQQSAGVHRPKFHGICDHRLWSWPLPGNHFSVRAWQISRPTRLQRMLCWEASRPSLPMVQRTRLRSSKKRADLQRCA